MKLQPVPNGSVRDPCNEALRNKVICRENNNTNIDTELATSNLD
jgi:hypothetical protein